MSSVLFLNNDEVRRVLAVKGVQELGRTIAAEFPEISGLYRAGRTQREIAETIQDSLDSRFEIGFIRRAVQFALKQLIPADEREIISQRHLLEGGHRSVENRSGIHGISQGERREAGLSKAENRVGLFGLSPGTIRKRATDALGAIMWEGSYVDPESGLDLGDYCFQLANDPQFFHQQGRKKNHANYSLISEKLNEVFGGQLPKPITPNRVRYYLNYRRSKASGSR